MSEPGKDIKKLGFGMMRLPRNEDGTFDMDQVKEMVDSFLEAGFTYFDTAWAYDGSEEALRESLVERYPRESFQIATKNAAFLGAKSREDAIAQFETSLERTGAGYFDFYLLHNLGENRTQIFEDYDMWNFVKEKKAEGKIRHIGFSFHDKADALEEVLKAHADDGEFVQLQINYVDWEDPLIESRKCYEVARKYGKGVIIMEPVKGGLLANPPEAVRDVFKAADKDASMAKWAVRFAASLDGVITVLSGMSTMEQMLDNISYMKDFKPLTDEEKAVIEEAQKVMKTIPIIPCTSCDYCAKVCPMEVGISGSFAAINILKLYDNRQKAIDKEKWLVTDEGRKHASECIKCGACEEVCPQHIEIRDRLDEVSEALGV